MTVERPVYDVEGAIHHQIYCCGNCLYILNLYIALYHILRKHLLMDDL